MSEELLPVYATQAVEPAARVPVPLPPEILEHVVTTGDLSKLNPQQRLQYYMAQCDAAGVDPRTRPFEYITLQGKLTLYARKECAAQLASKHGIRCEVTDQRTEHDVRIVTVRATARDGRGTDEIGCVPIKGLQGEALANALMKAVTKAKRRATLAVCGLGTMDESELEGIPGAATQPAAPSQPGVPPKRAETLQDVVVDAKARREAQTPAAPQRAPAKPQAAPAASQPQPTPVVQGDGVLFGVPVDPKVSRGWPNWMGYQCVEKPDSKLKLKGYTWEQATLGSEGGDREKTLRWLVDTAAREVAEKGKAPTLMAQRAAVTLTVMLERRRQEAEAAKAQDAHEAQASTLWEEGGLDEGPQEWIDPENGTPF